MSQFASLFDLLNGKPVAAEEHGGAAAAQLIAQATLATVVFAAIYGVAAGSTDLALALGNAYKMPMVVLLSALVAVPVGLLTWKLTGSRARISSLLVGMSAGNFAAALVLAALAPLVALYYHTTGYLGGALALGVGGLAFLVGMVTVVRAVLSRAAVETGRWTVALPLLVLCTTQTLALVQFIHVASPILPEVTVFDGGIDAMVDR
jgi:hypothetical protein